MSLDFWFYFYIETGTFLALKLSCQEIGFGIIWYCQNRRRCAKINENIIASDADIIWYSCRFGQIIPLTVIEKM